MLNLSENILTLINYMDLGSGVKFVDISDLVNQTNSMSYDMTPEGSIKRTITEEFSKHGKAFHFVSGQHSVFIQPPIFNKSKEDFSSVYSSIYVQNLETGEWSYITKPTYLGVAHSIQRNKFSELETIFRNTERTLDVLGISLPSSYINVLFLASFGESNKPYIDVNKDHIVFSTSEYNLFPIVIGNHAEYDTPHKKIELSPRIAVVLKPLDSGLVGRIAYESPELVIIDAESGKSQCKAVVVLYRSLDGIYINTTVLDFNNQTSEFTAVITHQDKMKALNTILENSVVEPRLMDFYNTNGNVKALNLETKLFSALADILKIETTIQPLDLTPTPIITEIRETLFNANIFSQNKVVAMDVFDSKDFFKDRINWILPIAFVNHSAKSKAVHVDVFYEVYHKKGLSKFKDELFNALFKIAQ